MRAGDLSKFRKQLQDEEAASKNVQKLRYL